MADVITIGAVRYLNARPLIEGLDGEPGVRLRLEVPGALGPLLRSGEVDVAMLPAIEYFRLEAETAERARFRRGGEEGGGPRAGPTHFYALPVAAIGSRGAIGSIRLFGYTEPAKLRRVLLDPASRTSNALARLIIPRRWGVQPHFVMPEEAGLSPSRPPDAEVIIGDPALVAVRPAALWDVDLGLEWHRLTHKAFVFAFWAARADAPVARIVELLTAARDRGLARREALAAAAPESSGVPADVARRYLMEQVRYTFGPKEQSGLMAFYSMAAEEGLAPAGARLRFPEEAAA